MKLGRVVWSKWGAPFLLVLGLAAPVKAEPPAAPASDPLSPSSLLSGPSLYETGKVGVSPDSAPVPAPTPIPSVLEWAGNGEKSIKPVAADIANAPPPRPPEGVIDPGRLQRETASALETVEDCRLDVARDKRIAPSKVVADRLILRWTIDPSGETSSTEVVAATPVDLDLMDCVKAAMSRWSFTRPRGGSIRIERLYAFHQVP
ncbi:MAG TPA: hypothetical protein VI456_09980 [Polyangia bacterium]